MQAMCIAKMHLQVTYYIAMCSPVVLLWMEFTDQILLQLIYYKFVSV